VFALCTTGRGGLGGEAVQASNNRKAARTRPGTQSRSLRNIVPLGGRKNMNTDDINSQGAVFKRGVVVPVK